jgi:hypothetical protein
LQTYIKSEDVFRPRNNMAQKGIDHDRSKGPH